VFRRVFPNDSLTHVVAMVRRMPAPGKPFIPAAPVPAPVQGTIVESVVLDPKAPKEEDKSRGLSAANGANCFGIGAVRHWRRSALAPFGIGAVRHWRRSALAPFRVLSG
jgi:hypothetical protein